MKKFVISLIILLLAAGAVFFIGWTEFAVPAGQYGVMLSKTGGIYDKVIQAGYFNWRYERLIPTNSRIILFSAKAQNFTKTIGGSLPSADLYKNMIEDKPDFSYSFTVSIAMSICPTALPAFVQKTGAEEQAKLDEYLETQAESISRAAVQVILDKTLNDSGFVVQASLSDTEILEKLDAASRFPDISLRSVHINDARLPDTAMYNIAKQTYAVYQAKIRENIEKTAKNQAGQAAADYLELERFSKLGRILSEYPLLIEFLSVSSGKNIKLELPPNPQVAGTTSTEKN